jgi:hypothetical protein
MYLTLAFNWQNGYGAVGFGEPLTRARDGASRPQLLEDS